MSTPTYEDRINSIVATGALVASLLGDAAEKVEIVSINANEIVVTFPFLASPYKITVEIQPEELA